jgi:catechol 2,3-dioxygenase-like lactoylglutathione lyase family enzyme
MLRGLDHLVVVVPDLAEAIAAYRALGFTVVPGGRHPPPTGTHNALIAFADGAYLELIAFYGPSPEHRWWGPLAAGGGLVDFCVATDELPGDAARLRAAGVTLSEPIERVRVRPDGVEVRWQLVLAVGPHRGVAPFLIRDHTPRELRVPSETTHANGALGVATLVVAVLALAPASDWYAQALGTPGEPVQLAGAAARGLRFRLGPQALDLVTPNGPAGPLAAWLAARGPGPWGATLRGAGSARGRLDLTRTMGARLAWSP